MYFVRCDKYFSVLSVNMANNSTPGLRNGKSSGQEELPEKYDETIIHKVNCTIYVVYDDYQPYGTLVGMQRQSNVE